MGSRASGREREQETGEMRGQGQWEGRIGAYVQWQMLVNTSKLKGHFGNRIADSCGESAQSRLHKLEDILVTGSLILVESRPKVALHFLLSYHSAPEVILILKKGARAFG